MEVVIRKDKADAELFTAQLIAKVLKNKPSALLGLATGRTAENVYANLAEMHKNEGLDFSLASSVNLDEYVGLAGDHDQSYRYYMNHHLFSKVNIPAENTHLPNGVAEDIVAECAAYENIIVENGGIDVQLLGIGTDGHIGFNEPGSSLNSRTRIKTLTRETVEVNGTIFGNAEDVPKHAITMGVGTILEAKECVLLATGSAKAKIIKEAIEGPLSAWVTGSALQLHNRAIIVVDEEAAAELQNYDYYKWAYDNKPEWQSLV